MNHTNQEKIRALREWADQVQKRIDQVKEAIQTAYTMDSWAGIPDEIRELTLKNALDEAVGLSWRAHSWIEPHDRFKVPVERFQEAMKIAREVVEWAEVEDVDNKQIFKVPPWATKKIVVKLKDAGIRHWINTI